MRLSQPGGQHKDREALHHLSWAWLFSSPRVAPGGTQLSNNPREKSPGSGLRSQHSSPPPTPPPALAAPSPLQELCLSKNHIKGHLVGASCSLDDSEPIQHPGSEAPYTERMDQLTRLQPPEKWGYPSMVTQELIGSAWPRGSNTHSLDTKL